MHLRLVDSTMYIKLSCSDCLFYDEHTKGCGVGNYTNPDNSAATNCSDYLDKHVHEEQVDNSNGRLLEEVSNYYIEDKSEEDDEVEVLLGLQVPKDSQYPINPDFPTKRKDAIWFTSADKTFGCWIVNDFPKRFMLLTTDDIEDLEKRYRSPYPHHDHQASDELKPFMCWHIDKDGYGQYTMLINGKIVNIH